MFCRQTEQLHMLSKSTKPTSKLSMGNFGSPETFVVSGTWKKVQQTGYFHSDYLAWHWTKCTQFFSGKFY